MSAASRLRHKQTPKEFVTLERVANTCGCGFDWGGRVDLFPVLLLVMTLFLSYTGYLLPWDQLALWAVTVGDGLDGYWPVFDDGVRFVLVGGAEVEPADYGAALAVHLLAHVIGAVAALGACALLVGKTAKAPGSGPGAFDESVCGFR